jgi:hypothetical protein
MSDYSDGSGQIPRRPRVNDGPPPVSGVVAIVLAVVAVVAGYFILRSITDDGNETGGLANPSGVETPADGSTPTSAPVSGDGATPTLAPVETTPPGLVTTGASVLVANANGQGGSAGKASLVLANSAGFQMTPEPTNATESTPDIDTSAIYFDPANTAAQTVANSLNTVMGGALNVQPLPDPVPIVDGDMKGAGVLLMLGKDFADMAPGQLDLTQVDPAAATAATNPPTGATTAPSSTTAP